MHNHNDLRQLTNNRRVVQLLQRRFVQLHLVVELTFEELLDGEHSCKSKIQSNLDDKRIKKQEADLNPHHQGRRRRSQPGGGKGVLAQFASTPYAWL